MSARRWLSDEQIAKLTHTGRLKTMSGGVESRHASVDPERGQGIGEGGGSLPLKSPCVLAGVAPGPLTLQCREDGADRKARNGLPPPVSASSGPHQCGEGGAVNQPALARSELSLLSAERVRQASSAAPIPYPLVRLCRMAGIAEPIPEYRFHAQRKWRFDYAWPMAMLAIEIEGGLWTQGRHSRGSGAIKDLEKYSEAAILGWRIIYATPQELDNGTCLDRVVRALTDKAAA